ncbi:15360_t:CDS:2 [Rhizophagus irregularis]|nr:15360_t:CDS:2 [Rhizophagus irregularis]
MTVKLVAFDHVAWINNGPYIPSYIPSYESKVEVQSLRNLMTSLGE